MLKFIRYTLLGLISFTFLGCAGGSMGQFAQPKNELPNWYLNPKTSNAAYYYGVAEGSSKKEAKINALNQIAAEISVSVSSSIDISKTSKNNVYSKEVESKTKASIEKIKFTGIEIIENAYNNGKFYTYLKVNRDILFNSQKKALDNDYESTISMWKHMQKNGVFELFKNGSKLNSNLDKIFIQLPKLKAINDNFNQDKYLTELVSIKNKARDMQSNAVVYVQNNKGSQGYQSVIKKYLSSFGMNLISNKSDVSNKKNLIIVDLTKKSQPKKVKTTDPRLKGASFADVVITIKTKNYKNKIIAQNRIKVINISKSGYNAASVKTAKFEREIKKQGIMNILLGETSN
jgi:hypothetical protein